MTGEIKLTPEAISEKLKLAITLDKFKQEFESRSFSGRNPDKQMVNCPYCTESRHIAPICKAKYAEGTTTFKNGRSFVKGRRMIPRLNARQQLLVVLTRALYPKYETRGLEPLNTMKLARAEAARTLRSERKAESKRVRDQQDRSRKINRG